MSRSIHMSSSILWSLAFMLATTSALVPPFLARLFEARPSSPLPKAGAALSCGRFLLSPTTAFQTSFVCAPEPFRSPSALFFATSASGVDSRRLLTRGRGGACASTPPPPERRRKCSSERPSAVGPCSAAGASSDGSGVSNASSVRRRRATPASDGARLCRISGCAEALTNRSLLSVEFRRRPSPPPLLLRFSELRMRTPKGGRLAGVKGDGSPPPPSPLPLLRRLFVDVLAPERAEARKRSSTLAAGALSRWTAGAGAGTPPARTSSSSKSVPIEASGKWL
mmetsp:Transcript_13132/g.43257  ORF Transcript_13132/g.43257 Transcript_13132/m.43257 type:complete len:282 (+) Transcript_13132:1583-2428(+)